MEDVSTVTLASYRQGAGAYEERARRQPALASTPWLMLADHVDLHGKRLRVLDVGAGPALAGGELSALGHHVTALEPVSEFAARARARVDVVVEAGADAVEDVEGTFDVVSSISVLHHLDQERAARTLTMMTQKVAPGGWLLVCTEEGGGERIEPAPWGGARYYRAVGRDELVGSVAGLGLTVVDVRTNTTTRPFLSVLARLSHGA